jgi:hypothetical protein
MSEHLLGMSKLGKSSSANASEREHITVAECKLLLDLFLVTEAKRHLVKVAPK